MSHQKYYFCHYNHELLSLQEEPGISKINLENVKIKSWFTWAKFKCKVKVKREQKIEN